METANQFHISNSIRARAPAAAEALGYVRPFGFGLPDAVVGRIQISMGVVPGGFQRGFEIADATFCRLPERGRLPNMLDRPGDLIISICRLPRVVTSLSNCKPKGFTGWWSRSLRQAWRANAGTSARNLGHKVRHHRRRPGQLATGKSP
jgi:hypothetical protein